MRRYHLLIDIISVVALLIAVLVRRRAVVNGRRELLKVPAGRHAVPQQRTDAEGVDDGDGEQARAVGHEELELAIEEVDLAALHRGDGAVVEPERAGARVQRDGGDEQVLDVLLEGGGGHVDAGLVLVRHADVGARDGVGVFGLEEGGEVVAGAVEF